MVDYYDSVEISNVHRALRPVELRRQHEMRETEWGGADMVIVADDAPYHWSAVPNPSNPNVRGVTWHGKIAYKFWPNNDVGNHGLTTLNRSGSERVVSRGSYLRDTHMESVAPLPTEPPQTIANGRQ